MGASPIAIMSLLSCKTPAGTEATDIRPTREMIVAARLAEPSLFSSIRYNF